MTRDGLRVLIERPDSWLSEEAAARYQPFWRDVPLHHALLDSIVAAPRALAAVSYDREGGRRALDYEDYDLLSRRVAGALARRGVGPGSAVGVMLPNCHEYGATVFGIKRLGAVYTGIPVTYGAREARYIINHVGASVWVVAGRYGDTDLQDLVVRLLDECPTVQHVLVLGPQAALTDRRWSDFDEVAALPPADDATDVDASAVCHIGFTSGTTGEPKGVMNTHNGLDVVMRGWVEHVTAAALGTPPVSLVPSPVGHHSGYLWGVLATAHLGGTAVFMERWDPVRALDIIAAEEVTTMVVAPTYVQDLAAAAERLGRRPTSLRLLCIAGAPVPRSLVPWAAALLDCAICPAWGMTEWGIGVSTSPAMPAEALQTTDGCAVPSCEVRVVGERGAPVATGVVGELQMRGPGLFVGYHDRPQYTRGAFSPDGWFATGDLARCDTDGMIVLEGRSKDVIIRGGLNLPVREIEDLLYAHADVVDAAVVAMPDPRLGERACAFVVVRPGSELSLMDVTAHLTAAGMSRHYLPERLEVVGALPRTMSGKIRKVELRQLAASLVQEA